MSGSAISGDSPWAVEVAREPRLAHLRLYEHQAPMSFFRQFELLGNDVTFARWYSAMLASQAADAWFWEHPPLTVSTLDRPSECVLIDAPALARLPADPAPFREQFTRQAGRPIATFRNLGGDALLVAPCPVASADCYGHLAAMVRHAPGAQLRALWIATVQALRQELGTAPRWLSTAGLGVYWLHVRIDSTPKYYRYAPYREAGAPRS